MARAQTPQFLTKFVQTLKQFLESVGIEADIAIEPVPMTRLHRLKVFAANFKEMRPSERQDLVWRIADQHLTPDEQLRISMILTLTPEEAGIVPV